MALLPRCSTCPTTYPACAGQVYPATCAGDPTNTDPTLGLVNVDDFRSLHSRGVSSIEFNWPSPQVVAVATGDGSGGLTGGPGPDTPPGG